VGRRTGWILRETAPADRGVAIGRRSAPGSMYVQEEANREGLDLTFTAILPRITP
jgi:hypothetical protein